MGEVSTHNDIDKDKRKIAKLDDKKIISTRNIIPYGRNVEKKDIDNFLKKIEKNKEVTNGNSVHDRKRTNKQRKRGTNI